MLIVFFALLVFLSFWWRGEKRYLQKRRTIRLSVQKSIGQWHKWVRPRKVGGEKENRYNSSFVASLTVCCELIKSAKDLSLNNWVVISVDWAAICWNGLFSHPKYRRNADDESVRERRSAEHRQRLIQSRLLERSLHERIIADETNWRFLHFLHLFTFRQSKSVQNDRVIYLGSRRAPLCEVS